MIEKKTILQLTTDSGLGGAERLSVWMAKYFDRDRYHMIFCTLSPEGPLHPKLREHDVQAFSLGEKSFFDFFGCRSRLRKLITEHRVDVLHSHLLRAGLVGLGLSPSIKILHTRHYGAFYERFGSIQQRFLDHYLMKHSNHVVAVSPAIQKYLVHLKKIPASRVSLIQNGIDLEEVSDASAAIEFQSKPFRLGVLGSLRPWKGQMDVLRALHLLQGQGVQVELFLFGEGPDRKKLQEWIHEHHMSESVHLEGFVSDPYSRLKDLHLLVIPSRTEGFGLVACEAMALGLPVLAAQVEGLADIVQPGRTGWLYPPGDFKELADRVVRLLHAPEELRACVVRAKEHVRTHFCVKRMVEDYQNLYDEAR